MFFVHYTALEKIPQPRSLVSSLPAPGLPELGLLQLMGLRSAMTGLPSVPSLPQPFSVTLLYAGPDRLVLINQALDYRGVLQCYSVPL